MAINCDVPTLVAASTAFLEPNMGESERDAIDLYIRVANLAAASGADYTGDINALLTAAAGWKVLDCNQRKAISLYIDMQNAVNNGAILSQATVLENFRCYQCIGTETRKQVLEFLKCAINNLGKPD
jgi:hypothetical protein